MTVAVLYATVSGNAETLARLAAERLRAADLGSVVENVADFPAARLREFDRALLIASTWGEGGPPPDAADFCAALRRTETLRLSGLRYAVFALGSRAYPDFCGCGRSLDADLAECGALRLLPCAEADTKFKTAFENWLERVVPRLTAAEADT